MHGGAGEGDGTVYLLKEGNSSGGIEEIFFSKMGVGEY